MTWRCANQHIWEATSETVVGHNKSWCNVCAVKNNSARRSYSLDDCHALAASKEGWCLSTKYENSKAKLIWKCACGHIWSTCYNAVHNGTWCIKCANERKRQANNLGIEKMHELAARENGKCISLQYDNVNSNLDWVCSLDHQFATAACNVIAGGWCPICRKGLSERVCRAIFEHLYKRQFSSCRPDWLLNTTGTPMELDGYCEDLALAFEYQGIQHYKIVHNFKVDDLRLNDIQDRDRRKAKICESRHVTLIQIPYTVSHVNLEEFVRDELLRLDKGLKRWADLPLLDLSQEYIRTDDKLLTINYEGKEKQLECLSKSYVGARTQLSWKCLSCGHEFKLSPKRLPKVVTPCEKCRKAATREKCEKETFKKIKDFLAARGEVLLSLKFVAHDDPLKLLCSRGHYWSTSWASLRHGTTCKVCRSLSKQQELNNIYFFQPELFVI